VTSNDVRNAAPAKRKGLGGFIEGDPEGGVAHHIGARGRAL
jgi:hypothetical protein